MWLRVWSMIGLVACGTPSVEGRWDLVRSEEGYTNTESSVVDYPAELDGRTVAKAMVITAGSVVFEDSRSGGDQPVETVTDGPYPWSRDEQTDDLLISGAADAMRCAVDDEVTSCTVTFESVERADFVMEQEYRLANEL